MIQSRTVEGSNTPVGVHTAGNSKEEEEEVRNCFCGVVVVRRTHLGVTRGLLRGVAGGKNKHCSACLEFLLQNH